ncbi:MAG: putative Ig domain-containing protein, partial [Sedimenticolaceae bacterium]
HMVARARAADGSRPVYELVGGPGDDRYEVLQPHQIYEIGTITELADEGTDTLVLRGDRFYLSPGLPDNVENLRYEYAGDVWVGADSLMLRGNALDNRIEIGQPNPDALTELHGLAGDDVLIGSDADESGNPSLGLFGGEGNDLLRGLGGADNLYGGPGDDLIEGGPGSDLLDGGQGRDTYVFAPGDSLRESGMSVIDDSDGGSVIRFADGVAMADLQFEIVDEDMLVSYSLEDTFIVKNGAMAGAVAWYELASGAAFTQQQTEVPAQENAPPVLTGQPPSIATFEGRPVTVSLAADLFSDPEGEALQISLTLQDAGPLPSWIVFDAAAARLDLDPADGDAGSYALAVTASDPAGNRASTSILVEVTDANFADGSADADILKGTASADNLDGGWGDDWLYGYAADDRLQGGDGNDRLYGHRGADELLGDDGDDILNGGPGDDRMLGGAGDDRYYVDALGDVVIDGADSGHDRIYSKVDLTLDADLEDLFLQGAADLQGTGNAADNRLYGNQGGNVLDGLAGDDRVYGRDGDDLLIGGLGNDTLHGGLGGDQMIGGIGDDRYFVDALADSVLEDADAGYDRLYSTIDTTLAAHVEALTLQGEGHLTGIGNALDNRLNGNQGDNQLRGEAGNDRLYGRDGEDVLIGGIGNDYLNGGLGSDEYQIGRGDGRDRIQDEDAGPESGDSNSIRFADGIRADELWFARSGENLVARIIGAEDQVTVLKWFASESRPLDHIMTDAGAAIAANQVDQLVAALATFDIPRASVIELSAVQQDEYAAIVAAHWQSPQAVAG